MKLAKIAKFDSLIELLDAFPDEESCIIYLEHLRWPNKVKSPFDKKSKVYHLGNHRYMCKNTQKIFNVKVGTIFHSTKLPLRKWFMAIWLVLSHKNRHKAQRKAKFYINKCRSASCMQSGLKQASA